MLEMVLYQVKYYTVCGKESHRDGGVLPFFLSN